VLTAIFGRHDRTSQLRDLGLLANEAPRFSDISRPEKRAARLSGRMCNGSRIEAWLDRRVKTSIDLPSARKKMIMTVQTRDKLMSLTDVSEMLGIPVQTLYRWRYKGDGPAGHRVGRHVRYRREAVEAGWSNEPTSAPRAPRMTPGSPYRPPPEVEAFCGSARRARRVISRNGQPTDPATRDHDHLSVFTCPASAQLSAGLSQALADAIPERCQALRLTRVRLRYRLSSMWQSAI
jgi:predicted DNA-binding transcriptional regulator AlpA